MHWSFVRFILRFLMADIYFISQFYSILRITRVSKCSWEGTSPGFSDFEFIFISAKVMALATNKLITSLVVTSRQPCDLVVATSNWTRHCTVLIKQVDLSATNRFECSWNQPLVVLIKIELPQMSCELCWNGLDSTYNCNVSGYIFSIYCKSVLC